MNSVIQLFFPILRTIDHTFQFNSSTECSLPKCLIDTVHSASNFKDADALKFRLAQYDTFYNGQIPQDSSECLMTLIEVINKNSMSYSGSNDNCMGVPQSDILFS